MWNSINHVEKSLGIKTFAIKMYFDGKMKLRAALIAENTVFQTNMLLSEISFKYAMKGVPIRFEEVEIKEELENLGFTVHKVIRLKNKNEEPMQMVLIQLLKTEKKKEIYLMRKLGNLIVTTEPLKKKKQWSNTMLQLSITSPLGPDLS